MSIEAWIDAICKLMSVSDGAGGHVLSYHVYDRAEFPAALTVFPCAVTLIQGVDFQYSMGGPLKGIYKGKTEFYLTAGLSMADLPNVMLYPARIRNACAGAMQLGGLVDHFILVFEPRQIVGPIGLKFNSEDPPRWGYTVNWEVKADEASDTDYSIAI